MQNRELTFRCIAYNLHRMVNLIIIKWILRSRTIDLFDKAKYLYTIYHEISLISEISEIDSSYEIPDELWNQIFHLLVHKPKRKKKTGRPRMDDRKAMTAIFYIARIGCQWKALPQSLGASRTSHDRFQEAIQWRI